MARMKSDLGEKLAGAGDKILARVPITSLKAVRSTCKEWDALTKSCVLGKEAAAGAPQHQFLTMNQKVYSLRFREDFGDVSVKQVDLLNELEVSKVYHCDGLVLCVAKDNAKLVLWNPYLCQTRCIGPRENFHITDRYAIGYGSERNHKILRFVYGCSLTFEPTVVCEIYEIRSNSWRMLEEVKPDEWMIDMNQRGASVNGNTYFFANHCTKHPGMSEVRIFLLCFDFSKETFGPRLSLPFHKSYSGYNGDVVTLSTFLRGGNDDEQLAVLFGGYESGFFEIWVSLSVEPENVSWSKFLRVEPGPFSGYGFKLYSSLNGGSFLVDEENKVAVVFELYQRINAHKAFVFGQDGSLKFSRNLGQALLITDKSCKATRPRPPLISSYRPSLLQVDQKP